MDDIYAITLEFLNTEKIDIYMDIIQCYNCKSTRNIYISGYYLNKCPNEEITLKNTTNLTTNINNLFNLNNGDNDKNQLLIAFYIVLTVGGIIRIAAIIYLIYIFNLPMYNKITPIISITPDINVARI